MMRRGLKGCREWEEDDGRRKRGANHFGLPALVRFHATTADDQNHEHERNNPNVLELRMSRREGTEVPRNAAVGLHLYAPPHRLHGAHRRSWCVLLRLEWQTTHETSEVRPVIGRLCSHAAESERLS